MDGIFDKNKNLNLRWNCNNLTLSTATYSFIVTEMIVTDEHERMWE